MYLFTRFLAGLIVAGLCTPVGVSGAFLLLPVQVQVFHIPSPAVSATNLLFNLIAAPAGAATFGRQGRLDIHLAAMLCAGTVPGVIVGALIRSTWLADGDRFGWVAAVVLVVLGIRLLTDRGEEVPSLALSGRLPPLHKLAMVGTVAGVVGGIYGLGGAALLVPWLVAVERLPFDRVAGAALLTTLATSVAGLLTFAAAAGAGIGDAAAPIWADGIAFGLGGLVGAVIGARLQPVVPVRMLRIVLAVAALVAAWRLVA